jgi:hypothetical protein
MVQLVHLVSFSNAAQDVDFSYLEQAFRVQERLYLLAHFPSVVLGRGPHVLAFSNGRVSRGAAQNLLLALAEEFEYLAVMEAEIEPAAPLALLHQVQPGRSRQVA